MTSSTVLTEDNVSKHILSFTRDNFLFTRTVCKTWYNNGADTNTKTNIHRAVDSPSTVGEAWEHGYPSDLYAPYLDAFNNRSDISVFQHLVDIEEEWIDCVVETAAKCNRLDVLQLFKKHETTFETTFDEKVLHSAVHHGHLEILQYLMGKRCPVDSTCIEWGFDDEVERAFKMRSMEIAVRDGRIDIVKQLRTVDYPFTTVTFEEALGAGNVDMLKFLKEEAGEDFENPYQNKFCEFVYDRDYASVILFLENDIVDDYKELVECVEGAEFRRMIEILVNYGCYVREHVVENALHDHNVDLAKFLVREYGVVPTSRAYGCLLGGQKKDELLVETLNWLHNEVGCKLESRDKLLVKYLDGESLEVQKWFHDRMSRI